MDSFHNSLGNSAKKTAKPAAAEPRADVSAIDKMANSPKAGYSLPFTDGRNCFGR